MWQLEGREHRRRHDWMGLSIYRELCQEYGVKCAYVWYNARRFQMR